MPKDYLSSFNEKPPLEVYKGYVYAGRPHPCHTYSLPMIVLCSWNKAPATKLRRILDTYCNASGQRINNDKSSILFSPNTSQELRHEVQTRLGISNEALSASYLGLPATIGANKKETFRSIKERVKKRLAGWKEKTLSFGGKEVLIKAVVQAIPIYSIQCFKLTKDLCSRPNRKQFLVGRATWRKFIVNRGRIWHTLKLLED